MIPIPHTMIPTLSLLIEQHKGFEQLALKVLLIRQVVHHLDGVAGMARYRSRIADSSLSCLFVVFAVCLPPDDPYPLRRLTPST